MKKEVRMVLIKKSDKHLFIENLRMEHIKYYGKTFLSLILDDCTHFPC